MRRLLSVWALLLVGLLCRAELAYAIVGGTDANWNEHPWLAKRVCQFSTDTEWLTCGCSSTIIHPLYAVTAGHCLNGPYPYKVGLMLSSGEVIEVVEEIKHPDFSYDSQQLKNVIGIVSDSKADIGLQKLAKQVEGGRVLNIFEEEDDDIAGERATVLGWGAKSNADVFKPLPDNFSPTSQQIDEVVIENEYCQQHLDFIMQTLTGGQITESPFRVHESVFCATPAAGPGGVCIGDGGGPLFTTSSSHTGSVRILGLVTDTIALSQENQCGNGIDIYTRLTPEYLAWIRTVTFGDVGPAHLWVGLKNSDDQGAQFDVRVRVLAGSTVVAEGVSLCVTHVTRNPADATEVVVPLQPVANGDGPLRVEIAARIGTTPEGTRCPGPGGSRASAVGLRLYYDSAAHPSRIALGLGSGAVAEWFLDSDGGVCVNRPAPATSFSLDAAAPTAAKPKCQDSSAITFSKGNEWRVIGTWNMTAP